MGKIRLFPTTEYTSKQPSDPVVPQVPCTGIFLGPSKSGKTVALISMIMEQYRGVEKIYIFSPSINIDDSWAPVKKYIEEDLGVNTERERAYYDEWDEAALRDIIQRQRKITETSKKLEMKKLYQMLIICVVHSSTNLTVSLSAAVRVNQQFLCCWRLRNQHELEAVIEELSALLPKDKLHRIYEQATRDPYSFLFVYYLKPKNEMFYLRFEERVALEKEADGNRGRGCWNAGWRGGSWRGGNGGAGRGHCGRRGLRPRARHGLGAGEHALPAPAGQRGRGRAGRPVRQRHE